MKKLLILGACLCFAYSAYAQTLGRCQYRAEDTYNVNGTRILLSTDQPVNGMVCTYALLNGNLIMEVPYKEGKVEGIARYYSDGKLYSEMPFINGVLDGVNRFYYSSGKLAEEATFKNFQLEGIQKVYNENGRLESETTYKNGKEEGIKKTYYDSGRLASEIPYKNDKREGYYQVYTESGRLQMKILYSNGEPVSGECGDGRVLTNAELINWQNGHTVSCTPRNTGIGD